MTRCRFIYKNIPDLRCIMSPGLKVWGCWSGVGVSWQSVFIDHCSIYAKKCIPSSRYRYVLIYPQLLTDCCNDWIGESSRWWNWRTKAGVWENYFGEIFHSTKIVTCLLFVVYPAKTCVTLRSQQLPFHNVITIIPDMLDILNLF